VADASAQHEGICLILLGGPGAGKGTQAARLADQLGVPRLSTGDMLREAAQKGSDVGRQAAPFLERGELVPDAILLSMVRGRVEAADCSAGFILDGFPRTVAQAESLWEVVGGRRVAETLVVYVDVPREELSRRLLARGRDDDQRATVEKRLEEYETRTAPLVDHFRGRLRLVRVDGLRSIEAVSAEIMAALRRAPAARCRAYA
jgi:adenylate kinase